MRADSDRRVTVITGTSRGIGKGLAEHYLERGHRVIGCSRSEPGWEADRYDHFELNVSDENGVRDLFREVSRRYGRVDHLINNAGVASMNHAMLTPLSTVRTVLDTNVVGTFLFCREAARQMQKESYGRIVNFTTVAVPLKLAGEAIYAASKAAIESLTRVLAQEFADFGITVNAIGPVPIETDLIRSVPREKIDRLIARQAIRRLGKFEDVIQAVDFFLDPGNTMVTGQILYLGGV